MQTIVQVPAGTCLLIGPTNPLYGQPGGAIQEFLIGRSQGGPGCGPIPQYLDPSSFVNQQPIGAQALLYGPRAGGGNAGAVAGALDRGPYPALYTGMDSMYNSLDLLNFGDPGPLRAALVQLDGEIHASVQTVMLGDSLYLREAVLGRMRQASFTGSAGPMAALGSGGPLWASAEPSDSSSAQTDALAYADNRAPAFPVKAAPAPVPAPPTVFWAQGIGAWGQLAGNGNAAGVNRDLAGFFLGADRSFTPNWLAGIAAGYTHSALSIADPASSADINTAHFAGYAGANFGPWDLRGAAAASLSALDTSRDISFPGFFDAEGAHYLAVTAQVFGEVGYGLAFGQIATEPFAGLAYAHLNTGRFGESGLTGVAALSGSGNSDDIGYSTLGARAAIDYVLANGMVLTPRAAAAWQHAIGYVTPTAALAFVSNGSPFTAAGVPLARDAALIQAGFDLRLNRQISLELAYFGEFGDGVQDNSVKGNLIWRF